MRFLIVTITICLYSQLSAQQEAGCKTTLFAEARLDSVVIKKETKKVSKDSANYRPTGFVDPEFKRTHFYFLRPPGEAYKIISFKMMFEDEVNDGIDEIECKGDTISQQAMRMVATAKDNPVFFTCIKVKHTSGAIFILKDLTINSARTFRWIVYP